MSEAHIERRNTPDGPYFAEFYLVVDGDEEMTATQLESLGHDAPHNGGNNWATQLRNYARDKLGIEGEIPHEDLVTYDE